MNAQKLFDSIVAIPEIKHIVKNMGHEKSTAKEIRVRILSEIQSHAKDHFGKNFDLMLKSNYHKEIYSWLNGSKFGCYSNLKNVIKPKFPLNGSSSRWIDEIEQLTRILVSGGFISAWNAVDSSKSLLKQFSHNQFIGRAGNAEFIRASVRIRSISSWRSEESSNAEVARDIIASGMSYLFKNGIALSGQDRTRVNVPLQMCRTNSSYEKECFNDAELRYYIEVLQHSNDIYDVSIKFRHVSKKGKTNTHNRIQSIVKAALENMPHVSGLHVGTGNHANLPNCRNYVLANFRINMGMKNEAPKEEKVVETSPAQLVGVSSVSEINEDDIRRFFEKKVAELSDELGSLISHRDTITEQINQKSTQQRKFKQILEAL
ncbi:hypothetical protein KNT87_gp073 [Erwinia phage Cronus]|uniref:Uncharacterized protein n=1 Tax=Erwinia phage Cronus TaxID=2163633 RepID=A0A2S1GM98_9CAUD|nr:hypothetical protein KNT87_gp073 [Erwinia phage Cronus]AWD90512.1 hypothetical protein [Erwinia phage Cronus]